MTPRATQAIVKKLSAFRDAGHDVGAVLDQSTLKGWTDVYEPKANAAEPSRSPFE